MKDIQVRYKHDNAGIVAKNTGRTRVITWVQMYFKVCKTTRQPRHKRSAGHLLNNIFSQRLMNMLQDYRLGKGSLSADFCRQTKLLRVRRF